MDFDLALASTFMSTAAAFLECDPEPECPIEDTYDYDGGGSSKDGSKDKKINTNNIVDKVKSNIPKVGDTIALADGTIGKVSAVRNVKKVFTKPSNTVPAGSFNITPES